MSESTYSPLSRRAKQLLSLLKRTKDKGVQRAILQALAREIEKGKRAVVRRAKEAAERAKDRIKYGKEFARKEARKASTRAKEPLMRQHAAGGQARKPGPKMTRDGYHKAAGLTPEQSRKVAAGPKPLRRSVRDRAAKVQAKLQSKARPVTVRNPAPAKAKVVHIGGKPAAKPARTVRPAPAPSAPARTTPAPARAPAATAARTPVRAPAAPARTPVPLPSQTVARDHAARLAPRPRKPAAPIRVRAPRARAPRPAVHPVKIRAPRVRIPIRGR